MPDEIYAGMDRNQPAAANAARDLLTGEAGREQLLASNHAMLPARQIGQERIEFSP